MKEYELQKQIGQQLMAISIIRDFDDNSHGLKIEDMPSKISCLARWMDISEDKVLEFIHHYRTISQKLMPHNALCDFRNFLSEDEYSKFKDILAKAFDCGELFIDYNYSDFARKKGNISDEIVELIMILQNLYADNDSSNILHNEIKVREYVKKALEFYQDYFSKCIYDALLDGYSMDVISKMTDSKMLTPDTLEHLFLAVHRIHHENLATMEFKSTQQSQERREQVLFQ
ncbi:hypothetical protein [Butyrivibrio sp. NC3005]|uniref:hypothetical protein n=1 Tax=Butyrivibrio sp. NC3005 TaxID=1280685 RepID=UPI0003F5C95D|nr:hypothetical protein [Butyrivibrio sp. NC3005]